MRFICCRLVLLVTVVASLIAAGQTKPAPAKPVAAAAKPGTARTAPDLTRQPTLYVVGYAHLDTEWRWEYPQVISEYLSKTLRSNFALFQKYPDYVFNFSGANRYRMMKEYYPQDFVTLKKYVAQGRWFPAGSSMEESDVNSPSAESIFRQVLYGNEFFRREFGKASYEYMLPDCFGFPASLPSILGHAGIKGFSTQKLTWGSSAPAGGPDSPEHTPEGTPFNVGVWQGPDGHSILAAFNPGSYAADITTDLSKPLPPVPSSEIPHRLTPQEFEFNRYQGDFASRVETNGKATGLYTDYHYYGTGDIGGAPSESSVKLLEAILHKGEAVTPGYLPSERAQEDTMKPVRVGEGPVKVISAPADQMFLDIKPTEYARLPHYKGELELTNHSAGSLSSEAYQKRWNRENEVLGQAAEEASLAAEWLGGKPYPLQRINDAWTLVMGGQFHDIMAGTATPKSYNYAWNDDVIAMNQFAGVINSAVTTIASAMNTEAQGQPVVVYNPLNIARQDVVEADLRFPQGKLTAVRVLGPDGKEVPAQVAGEANGATRVLFLASAPSVGFAVYDVQPGESSLQSELQASDSGLENARYRIKLDQNGDISSLFDKKLNREMLSAPIRLAFQTEAPHDWPAWNMDWKDESAAPRGYIGGASQVRVVENGPARVAVEVSREAEGSKFVETIRLSAGSAGDRVEFANSIDWRTERAALKAVFPLAAANENATYNWDVGTIERPTMNEKKFEVPSHQWFDLTDQGGGFGVTVLSDKKYGSDKPDDHTLRLTLIYTPGLGTGNGRDYADQTSQDFGHHEILYGLAAHDGDWRKGATDWQAWRLNQPLLAFTTATHAGTLGKEFSFVRVDNPRVRVLGLKKAEHGNEIVVRMVELNGQPESNVHVQFAAPVVSAREVNAQEMPLGTAKVEAQKLVSDFTPYGLHTIAVKLAPAAHTVVAPQSLPVRLPYNASVATRIGMPADGCFDCQLDQPASAQGDALPAESLPAALDFAGVHFALAPFGTGQPDAVIARGQQIALPAEKYNRVYVVAAAIHGDQQATFEIGNTAVNLKVQEWTGDIGQWDSREFQTRFEPMKPRPGTPEGAPTRMRKVEEFTGQIDPGYIKRADLAWYSSDRHGPAADHEPYSNSYLFVYPVDLPAGARTLTLPKNDNIRVLAVSVAHEPAAVEAAYPLYDTLGSDQPHPKTVISDDDE
jgi:alpha-mannosidase